MYCFGAFQPDFNKLVDRRQERWEKDHGEDTVNALREASNLGLSI